MLLFLLACTGPDKPDGASGLPFALPSADLGAPLTAGAGLDPSDADGIGLALDALLPVFDATAGADPAWDTPMAVWALLEPDTVRDRGVCPIERIDDGVTTHVGGCRSSSGYEFTGELSTHEWEEAGVDYYRLEADLEVVGDTEGAAFDRVRIVGALQRAAPEDGAVDAHLDLNLHIEVDGYFEAQHTLDDPRLDAWRSWTVSGSLEQAAGAWVVGVAADIGGAGGLLVESTTLTQKSTCPIEAVGEATLGDGVTAIFEGVASCDACARVTSDAGEVLACAPPN
ncbi:MAG: hypothetical protein V4850_27595 [Myxococcota bacterium]